MRNILKVAVLKIKEILKNRRVQVILQLAFTLFLLILVLNSLNLLNLLQSLSAIDFRILFLSLLVTLGIRFIWAYQISISQAPLNMHFSVYEIFRIQMIATFYTLFLPGNLVAGGVSWYKLSQPGRKFIEAGALLIFFRLIQISSLICMGMIFALGDPQLSTPRFRTFIIIGILIIITLWILFFSNQITRIFNLIAKNFNGHSPFIKSVFDKVERLINTILKFRSLGLNHLIFVFGLSLFAQLLVILSFFFIAKAVGIQLSIFVIGWISSFVNFVQMIPISIAGLGVREISYAVLLSDYGISIEQAVSYSITIFGAFVILALLGGLFELSDIYRKWHKGPKSETDRSENITH